jgi:hypothetical protein
MTKEFTDIYDSLIPFEQAIIDCMLLALSNKNNEIERLTKHMQRD